MALFQNYIKRLHSVTDDFYWHPVDLLVEELRVCWQDRKRVFLCGNGGSAANAIHMANDLVYASAPSGSGIRALALPANIAIISCIGNDMSYQDIFSHQIATQGDSGDVLIALSGSGNSENIVRAIKQSQSMGIKTFAILGYDGGVSKDLADIAIHFPVDDMQIAEDLQLIVGHMVMQKLMEPTDDAKSSAGESA
ncbi:MAG TPA: SIS domain-containing protein [Gammaproteobacteria bacterium]|nr:SIS domain-containing protein [Gammaproteobacteria bacterium]